MNSSLKLSPCKNTEEKVRRFLGDEMKVPTVILDSMNMIVSCKTISPKYLPPHRS